MIQNCSRSQKAATWLFGILSFTFLLTFCNMKDNSEFIMDSSDFMKINFEVSKSAELQSFAKNIEYIPLETNEECLISEITKIQNTDRKLYVLSKKQKSVFIFDLLGNYITKIAEFGEGPGKYSGISDFLVKDEFMYLLTEPRRSIYKYNLNGDFIQEIKTNDHYFYEFEMVSKGWLTHLNDAYDKNHKNNIKLYNFNFSTHLYNALYIDRDRRNNPNKAKNYMAQNSTGVYFYENFSNVIYFYNDTIIAKYLEISIDGKSIPDHYPRWFNDNPNEALHKAMEESQFIGFNNILATDKYLLLKTNKGKELISSIVSLHSNRVISFANLTSKIEFSLIGDFVGVLNQKFILQSYSTLLDQLKRMYDSGDLTAENLNNELLFNVIRNYEYEDNPVLVVVDVSF